MQEFTDILTHARRLNAATKDLTVAELEDVASKLATVIEKRKEEEAELRREQQEKLAEIERFRKQLEEAGLSPEDLLAGEVIASSKTRKTRQPKPAKYAYVDANGERKTWTGQGRTPKVIQQALDKGRTLESFEI
ncbi:MAG: H-NS histone family protein [Aliidiomarina sp.]|uniref:H-NS family histone-like protein n=1 Tax=Aliidiomarina sp. TaxID=1872439 RepID=UPI0025C6D23B|nr:H-NS family nucleoid-associated regulatory protein [Aliidiomarina sp.]MCH8502056.1 H-NS histone family protein [Aliidiomarina sp.]